MSTVDVHGAAKLLHVHENKVRELIQAGALPAAKVGVRLIMLEKDVIGLVEQLIAKQTADRMKRKSVRL